MIPLDHLIVTMARAWYEVAKTDRALINKFFVGKSFLGRLFGKGKPMLPEADKTVQAWDAVLKAGGEQLGRSLSGPPKPGQDLGVKADLELDLFHLFLGTASASAVAKFFGLECSRTPFQTAATDARRSHGGPGDGDAGNRRGLRLSGNG